MVDAAHVVSMSALEEKVEAAVAAEIVQDKYLTLSTALTDIFNLHKSVRVKAGIDREMTDALYAFSSLYTPEKQAKLEETAMSTVYLGVIGEKCSDAMSWLVDVFLGATEKPWQLKPTPVPTVPLDLTQLAMSTGVKAARDYAESLGRELTPEDGAKAGSLARQAMQDAVLVETNRRAKEMERQIQDQLVEGGWSQAMQDFIFDIVVEKAAILKGPVTRERQKREWKTDKTGRASVKYNWTPVPTVSRVSPFNAYPSPSSVGFEGDFVERIRYTLSDLFWMLKQTHFVESQVRAVINEFAALSGGNVDEIDNTVAPILQGQTGQEKVAGTVEGLDFWLTVTGDWLIKAGWPDLPFGGKAEAGKLYHIEAITVAGKVVFLGKNEDERGLKPYYKMGWVALPGSFWYKSLPGILKDIQEVCNAATRSLVNNMGLSSGFQTIIPDINRLLSGKVTTMFPHKVWQFRNPGNTNSLPVDFKQPDSNAAELLAIISECRKLADSRSGVPKYLLGGEPPPGVGRTASGISMLLNSAAKGIRRVVISIDRNVVCPLLQRFYEKNLSDSSNPSLLGDVEVAPAGAVETLIKSELAERRLGLLDAISKSEDRGLVSVRGRSELWRESFRSAEMDGSAVLEPVEKVEEEAARKEKAERAKIEAEAQAAQAQAQVSQLAIQIEQEKLAIEKQRLVMESKILGLKLQSQIAESTQRAMITRKMSSSIDLKTAEQIGAVNVPEREETVTPGEEMLNEPVPNEPEVVGPVAPSEAEPGVPGVPEIAGGIPPGE